MAEQAVNDEHAEIKKRAVRRLIVAGSLVTAAIVALTVLNQKPEEHPAPATAPEAPSVAIPAQPEALPEKAAEEALVEAPSQEAPALPDSEAAPAMTPPPPPQVLNKPSQLHTETAAQTTPRTPGTDIATSAKSGTPQTVTISPPPPAKTITEQATVASKPSAAPPAPTVKTTPPAAPKGYVVQLGLFSNYENAVQLQKRLAEHGIKSYTETRLHVGPFQNKAEADQAMTRIRNMGINAVLVPAH